MPRVPLLLGGGSLAYLWAILDPSPLSIGVGLISTVLIAVGLTSDELALKGLPEEEWIDGFRVERSGRRSAGRYRAPELVIRVIGPSGHTAEMTGLPFLGRERDTAVSWDHVDHALALRDGRHELTAATEQVVLRILPNSGEGLAVEGLSDTWRIEPNLQQITDLDVPERLKVLMLAYVASERVELIR